jgi:hypothetical protein
MMFLSKLHRAPELQTRGLSQDTVSEYTAAAKDNATFPQLLAYTVTDRDYPGPALVDGWHRDAALAKAKVDAWAVDVREGTFAEAWLAGWVANRNHGLRYSKADKRKAAETALKLYPADSSRVIADRIGVSHELVNTVRQALTAAGQLEPTDTVTSKDGAQRPATGGQSDETANELSVTDSSQEDPSEQEPAEPDHVVTSPPPPPPAPGEVTEADAGPETVDVNFGGAGDCKKAAASLLRLVKRIRAGVSCLVGSTYGEQLRNVFACHAVTELHRTGKQTDLGSYGGVITVGPPEWNCTALDELGGQLATCVQLLDRIDRQPVQPRTGEHHPAPWESVEHLADTGEEDVEL